MNPSPTAPPETPPDDTTPQVRPTHLVGAASRGWAWLWPLGEEGGLPLGQGVAPDALRLQPRPGVHVVAGDRVVVEGDNVQAVAPRVRVLKRAVRQRDQVLAAHVDRLVVVVAAGPALRQGFVMRSVVVGALQGLPCTVVVNKVDMDRDGEAGRTVAAWQALGLHVLATSAATGEGVESLRDLVATGLTVFMGQSGVGKSSLINLLRPFARLRTGGLDREGMGRHTTTLALGILSHGSLLVDLPGIRELGLSGATPESVLCAFPDVAAAIPRCRFPACAHRGDAGCAVEEEVRAGRLDAARVELCLRMQESVAGGMEGGGRV